MSLERVLANLVHKVENRYFGKYRGFVVDNADPEHLGRLRVTVPSVLGDKVVSGWAMPCTPYGGDQGMGFLAVPEIKAGVWVEFEEGDLEFPIWVGTFWSKPGGESELPKPNKLDGQPEDAVQDPPTRKIFKTKKGHTLQFEDADGQEMITLVEAKNNHVILLNKDGIKITDGANKHEITLNEEGVKVADGVNSHEIVLDGKGIVIKDGTNETNNIAMESSGITIKDKNNNKIIMNSSGMVVKGLEIDLNEGSSVCLKGLVDWLLSHQHIGNMGAPTPLFPPNAVTLNLAKTFGNGILSTTVKAK